MNTDTILRLLENSGFHILGMEGDILYLEDPSCILRSFETFIEYAWLAIICITGLFLFGWAISMIRGAKTDYFTNLRNLIIILGTVSAVVPIVNLIWGDDLFARGCRTIQVSMTEINEVLETRNLKLAEYEEFKIYENMEIYDSGAPNEQSYAEESLIAPDVPKELESVSVTTDTNTVFQIDQNSLSANTASTLSAVRAAETSSEDVIYTQKNGKVYRKTGGSRAWRNNNPGNIRYSEFTRKAGAIGEAGGFAVFPDEETGMRAISRLLRTNSYNRLTVAGAISRYSPPTENNTAAYHRKLQELTQISINRQMSSLSDEELSRMAKAIRQIEGWKPGRVVEN